MGAALGAAYGGSIAVTASSGPGIALKGEAIGLGVMTELPVVILNIQRGGPSTGLPTKTEQSDLLQSLYGRNGESPIPVLAAKSPGDTFYCAIEAVKIATRYMVPVMLLSDGYIANGSEPWPLPNLNALPRFEVVHRTDPHEYFVYQRDPRTLARAWVVPGTPGLEHRIGGIEKDALTGNISYAPDNHEKQTHVRAEKIERIGQDIGELDLSGGESGDVLLVGWGGTYGALRQAQQQLAAQGKHVSHAHLRWLSPLEPGLAKIIRNFKRVIVAELNMGQLRQILRATFLIDVIGLNKIQGQPFKVREVLDAIDKQLDAKHTESTTVAAQSAATA
jgi:2-oxoglutarate ferredoxin oxidoreductase subunit alpha